MMRDKVEVAGAPLQRLVSELVATREERVPPRPPSFLLQFNTRPSRHGYQRNMENGLDSTIDILILVSRCLHRSVEL